MRIFPATREELSKFESDEAIFPRFRFSSPFFFAFSSFYFSSLTNSPTSMDNSYVIHCDGLTIRIKSRLGQGCFGNVYSVAIDGEKGRYALKLVGFDNQIGYKNAATELKILKHLSKHNSHKYNIVKTEMLFIQKIQNIKCSCILMERMSLSLEEFRQTRDYKPFPLKEVKAVASQILIALKHIHKIGIVHADLKPTNILCTLLTRNLRVKLADFGNSETLTVLRQRKGIQPLGFRAPEIVLGLPFDERIDLFGLGCVLAELYSARRLFPADNIHQLTKFHFDLLGLPNGAYTGASIKELFEINPKTGKYEPILPESLILDGVKDQRNYEMETIRDIAKYGSTKNSLKQTIRFLNLLEELLLVNAGQRVTAKQALLAEFICH